jgi:hypothetical protein
VERKKTYEELEAENRVLRSTGVAMALAPVAINIVRWAGACVIAYFGYASIASLAGKTTLSAIGINFLSNVTISNSLAWLLGGGGIIFGVRQRRLRRQIARRLERIPQLEAAIDPGRTSSRLAPGGVTNPKDRE